MSSLKMRAASSVKITSLSMMIVSVLQIIQLIVLGRVLGPEVFGMIALIQIVVQFAQMYMDMGITDAIIQKEKISKAELSSLYWFSIAVGLVLFLILFITAPVIAGIFNEPKLTTYIQVIGISFVIIPFGLQFQTIATKNLEFADISKYEILATFIGTIITIVLAVLFELGAWSLVWGHFGISIFRTLPWVIIGFRNSETRPLFFFSWFGIKDLIFFGMYRLGTATANFFNTKIDQIVIGILMGPQILGYYSMAMNIIMQPIQRLNPMITRVSFPVFSKIQNDKKRLQKAYLFIIQLIMTLNAPLYAGLVVLAPYFIPLILGPEWGEAILIVQILSFYALFRSLGNPSGSLFIAVGKVRWSFYWQVALLFIVPVVVYFSSLSGEIIIVALSMGILRFLLFFINYFSRIRFIIGNSFNSIIKSIFIPVIHSIIMMAILQLIILQLPEMADAGIVVINVIVGFCIYSSLLLVFQKKLLQELKGFFVKRSASKGDAIGQNIV